MLSERAFAPLSRLRASLKCSGLMRCGPAETNDLSAKEPARLKAMTAEKKELCQ